MLCVTTIPNEGMPRITVPITTCPTDSERFPARCFNTYISTGQKNDRTLNLPRLCAMATLTIVFNLRLVSDLLTVS